MLDIRCFICYIDRETIYKTILNIFSPLLSTFAAEFVALLVESAEIAASATVAYAAAVVVDVDTPRRTLVGYPSMGSQGSYPNPAAASQVQPDAEPSAEAEQ